MANNRRCWFAKEVFSTVLAAAAVVSLSPSIVLAQEGLPPGIAKKHGDWLPPGQAKKLQDRDHDQWRGDRDRDEDRARGRDRDHDRDKDRDRDWHRDRDRWSRDNHSNRWLDRNRREIPQEDRNRQQTKNNWRNLAIGAGAVALYGYLKHDPTITFVGAAGALYSLNRYEQDRKSQSQADRARAEFFSRPYFTRDGHRYNRRLVTRNGQRYYQFVRG